MGSIPGNRTALSLVAAAILAAMLLACALFSRSDWPWAPLSPHRGDGVFQDKSGWRGPIFVNGFTISMPEFDLDRTHEAEYHFTNLPNIKKTCGIYLAIAHDGGAPPLRNEKNIDGTLEFELMDSDGDFVTTVGGRLGDYIWAHGGKYELYQLDKSFFRPDPKEEYKLRVRYSPDSRLASIRGFVWIRCGGSL